MRMKKIKKFLYFLLQQKMIYIDKIVNLIIRPTRDQYHVRRLGDPEITIETSRGQSIKCIREDRVILNKHNEHIHLSYYAIQQNEHYNTTQEGYSYNLHQKNQNINPNTKNTRRPSLFTSHPKVTNFKNKCVIYLHANNGSRIQGMTYLSKLIQAQCNVCLFDCSGSGLSEGQYITLGLKQARDLDCVVNFLVRQKRINEIILWGRSMGAATAIIYGSKHSKVRISAMVLDSPFKNLQKLIIDLASDRTGLPKIFFQPLIPLIRSEILNKTGYNIDELNLKRYIQRDIEGSQTQRSKDSFDNKLSQRKYLSNNKCDPQDKLSSIPTLFIVSKNDKFVHYSHTEKLFKRYRCQDKNIMYIETEHHEMRDQKDIDQIIKFIVNHLNLNNPVNEYEIQNVCSLKFTKNVLTRSRLDTNRVKIKEQFTQEINQQKKDSLSPTFVTNNPNILNNQPKTNEKYSFYSKKLTSKTVHNTSNPIEQYLTSIPKKMSYHLQSTFSNNHQILTQSIPHPECCNIRTVNNDNLSQSQNNPNLNSTPIIKNLEQFKTLKHNSSHQTLVYKEKKNQLKKLNCYSEYDNGNNYNSNKIGIKSYQIKTFSNNLNKINFTQINKGKISLSSMLAHQQNTTKYPNNYLHENSYEQEIKYQTLKDKKIYQQPYLSLSKNEQVTKAYPYPCNEKSFFSNNYKKPQNCQIKESNHPFKTSIISSIEPTKSNFPPQFHYEPRKVSTYNRFLY